MKTVKDLIAALLEYPMDATVAVEVNGEEEHDIEGTAIYGYSDRRVVLKIEIPEDEE